MRRVLYFANDMELAMRKSVILSGAVLSVFATAAFAHHSNAMYDQTRNVEVDATVKMLEWTNPHAWVSVTYTDASRAVKEVDLELGSPTQLVRQGWRPKIVAPGDKVKVSFKPHKDGKPTGFLDTISLPDGRTLTSE
jgi:hypothetical protein